MYRWGKRRYLGQYAGDYVELGLRGLDDPNYEPEPREILRGVEDDVHQCDPQPPKHECMVFLESSLLYQ